VDYALLTGAQYAAGRGADGADAAAAARDDADGEKKPGECDREKNRNCPGGGGGGPKQVKVSLQFKAKVGNKDFACGREYSLGTARTKVTPADLRLNFQDIVLIRDDNKEVPLKLDVNSWQGPNIALLDFEDGSGNCEAYGTAATNKVITGTVPEGKYVGVAFTNGVPKELNHGDPLTAPEPLKSSDMLWSWLVGHRFTQIEFVQVVPVGELFASAWLHVGSTACTGDPALGNVTCSKPNRNRIVLKKFDWKKDTVTVDPGAIWAKEALTEDVGCHSAGEDCPALFKAIGVDFGTGQASSGQTVYRVEK
jgi:uncharacterized repeat protein (TIGR04052 family)